MISTTSVAPQTLQVTNIPDHVEQLNTVNVEYDSLNLNVLGEDLGLDNEIKTTMIPEETHLVQSAHPQVENVAYSQVQNVGAVPEGPSHPYSGESQHPRVQHRYHDFNHEDLITELEEKTEPEFILNIGDEFKDVFNGNPVLKPINTIVDDVERAGDTVLEDIYPDGKEDLKDAKWWTYIYYFRWFLNFIFVGCPYMFWSSMMVIVNIVLNILLNKWWAGGNWLLIFNTGYLIFQTIMSWPLVFEIPFYLRNLRYFRLFSSGLAFVYTGLYAFVVFDWIYQLDWEPESVYEDYQFLDIIVNMYLGYNVLFNIHLMPVNFAIISKEIFLEIFPPLLKQDQGSNLDGNDIVDVVNPKTYVDLVRDGSIPNTKDHTHYDPEYVLKMQEQQKKAEEERKQRAIKELKNRNKK